MIPNLLEQALASSKVKVLALDPGETTGACVFHGPKLHDSCQLPTGLMPTAAITVRTYIQGNHHRDFGPIDAVVMESYRVYSWKSKDHSWAGLHTPRLIGAIELICFDLGIPLYQQSAQQGKGFVTDDKLQDWGLWQEGQRHARDAIRHAVYYLLFKVAKVHAPTP